jgi:hypothetical protein
MAKDILVLSFDNGFRAFAPGEHLRGGEQFGRQTRAGHPPFDFLRRKGLVSGTLTKNGPHQDAHDKQDAGGNRNGIKRAVPQVCSVPGRA